MCSPFMKAQCALSSKANTFLNIIMIETEWTGYICFLDLSSGFLDFEHFRTKKNSYTNIYETKTIGWIKRQFINIINKMPSINGL